MNHKKIVLLLLTTLIITGFAATDSVTECSENEVELASMNDTSKEIAEPDVFETPVCVEDEDNYSYRENCVEDEVHFLSMTDGEGGELTRIDQGNLNVCSLETRAYISNSCGDDDEVISVENSDGGKVGNEEFDYSLCISNEFPSNYTLEFSELEASFEEVEDFYVLKEEEEHVRGIINYGSFIDSTLGSNSISMTLEDGKFLLPNTIGGLSVIDNRRSLVEHNSFLDEHLPSFNFQIPESPVTRVILQPDKQVEGFEETLIRRSTVTTSVERDIDGNQTVKLSGD